MAIGEERVHNPVLLKETIHFLNPKGRGIYVDGTLGGGGHALGLLEARKDLELLVGIDQDGEILEIARERLKPFASKVRIRKGNFSEVGEILKGEKISGVDGILLDLGVSSLQLDEGRRGFSFRKTGPVDMRMDPSLGKTALEKIKESNVEELARVLEEYGEERFAEKIARGILEKMKLGGLQTTTDLAQVAFGAYPPWQRSRIDPATRTFLALRLWVNEELVHLKKFLKESPLWLNPGGKICVMSYHSLEDRMVKHSFRNLAKKDFHFRVVTKKPVRPGEIEIAQNPRARSAKLRVLEKGDSAH